MTSCLLRWAIYRISLVIRRNFIFFQNNPKDLDPSWKTDLDLLDCLGRVNLELQLNFIGLIFLFEVILEGQKTPSYSRINMVLLLKLDQSSKVFPV